jgi:hypothetical protein
MASPWQIFKRIFFWSYERGTWQYDVAVVTIVLFVIATPAQWFHDQPQVVVPAAPGQVQLVKDDGKEQIYRVDARVLAPPEQTPALENDLHNALQKSLPDLRHGRFEIIKIEAERDAQGTVIAYHVEVHH